MNLAVGLATNRGHFVTGSPYFSMTRGGEAMSVPGVCRWILLAAGSSALLACAELGLRGYPASTVVGWALLSFVSAFVLAAAYGSTARQPRLIPHTAVPRSAPKAGALAALGTTALLGVVSIAGAATMVVIGTALLIAATVAWLGWGDRLRDSIIEIVQ